jgi:hypothetical protein
MATEIQGTGSCQSSENDACYYSRFTSLQALSFLGEMTELFLGSVASHRLGVPISIVRLKVSLTNEGGYKLRESYRRYGLRFFSQDITSEVRQR